MAKIPETMSIKEAAATIGCSVDKVERLIREQVFTTYKPGGSYRIDKQTFTAWFYSTQFNPIRQPRLHHVRREEEA